MPGPAYMQAPPGVRRSVDILVLCLAAGCLLALCARNDLPDSGIWHWSAVARSFFHFTDEGSLVPGPLGIGLLNTLRVIFLAVWPATCIGLTLGLARSSPLRLPRMLGTGCVAVTRNLPPLVLVFIFHYFLAGTVSTNIDWEWTADIPFFAPLLPESRTMPVFISAVAILGIYEGAYVGEIVRAGIASAPREQWEAAASLGFSRAATLRLVILPQTLRFMLPSLTSQMTALIKDSAIVSVISVQELTFQGLEFMTSSGMAGEIWISVTLCYLFLCTAAAGIGKMLERRCKG